MAVDIGHTHKESKREYKKKKAVKANAWTPNWINIQLQVDRKQAEVQSKISEKKKKRGSKQGTCSGSSPTIAFCMV